MLNADEVKAWRRRWQALEERRGEEERAADVELRWRRLNAAHALGVWLGLAQRDAGESGVFVRWAQLKDKASQG